MSVFDLNTQNANLDNKIVAGLERLSQVFRILLWEKAKLHGLSPIQIQLLIFLQYHNDERSTVSYLSREFNYTKPTISDAIKILEQKGLLKKTVHSFDTRSYTMQLTVKGKKLVAETENYTAPLSDLISKKTGTDKVILWDTITSLIYQLNQLGVISVQRMCFNCRHYSLNNKIHFCNLLKIELPIQNIRIDCPEFETAQ